MRAPCQLYFFNLRPLSRSDLAYRITPVYKTDKDKPGHNNVLRNLINFIGFA